MKGIFSGRQIRDLKGRGQKITRSQTAAQAYNAVIQKYGEVQDGARYFHKGNGVWQKYSIENDSKRTGKIAPSRSAWEEQPQRLDWWGIDTKGDKPKRKFSVGQIKAQAKISTRKSKVLPKFYKKPAVKAMSVKVEVISKPAQEKVSDFLYTGDIEGAKKEYIRAYGHEYPKMPYTDPKITKAFESFRKRTVQEWLTRAEEAFRLGRELDVRLLFRGAWLAEGKPKDEKKIEAEYKKRFSNKKPSKAHFSVNQLKQANKALKVRKSKAPIQKYTPVTKVIDSNAYMKSSPFTNQQISMYNNYSFYDVDINKEFNNSVNRMEATIRKHYPKGVPAEVLKALARYRKAVYESYLAESRARFTAPSQAVVGPAGYKNFDKKRARADSIRQESLNNVHYAEKQIDLAIKRVNTKDTTENIKGKYAVNIGDTVMLYWTNNYHKYIMPAKVIRVNVNTLVGKLLEDNNGYTKGQEISVPMNGTKGNRWSHLVGDKPAVATKKELVDKYLAEHPSPFKVGDKVFNTNYRFNGTIIKMNKQTMVIKGEPTYQGDDGIRKVPNDERVNKKL